jgi:hypothetical protein
LRLFQVRLIENSASLGESFMLISRYLGNPGLFAWLAAIDSSAPWLLLTNLFRESRRVPHDILKDASRLSFAILDNVLANHCVACETEDALLDTFLSFGNDGWLLLRHSDFDSLSLNSFRKLLAVLAKSIPSETVWFRAMVLLCPLRVQSTIVGRLPGLFKMFNGKRSRLLWRGSRDGFRASDFHSRCNGHRNTLAIVRDDQGNVFGGFTPVVWESRVARGRERNCDKPDPSHKSFLFAMSGPRYVSTHLFPLRRAPGTCAISCDASCGPDFGGGSDLVIADECDKSRYSYTGDFGRSYVNGTALPGFKVLAGEARFKVQEVEVFEIVRASVSHDS